MNCKSCQELLPLFALGELELSLHRQLEAHTAHCEDCRAELLRVRSDILKLSTALGSEVLPPTGLLQEIDSKLPDRQKPWVLPRMLFPAVAIAACLLLLVVFFTRSSRQIGVQALSLVNGRIQALELSDATAAERELSLRTGIRLTPIKLASSDKFERAGWVHVADRGWPVVMYRLGGTDVACYQLSPKDLLTRGLTPISINGQTLLCCTRNGCAVVAVISHGSGYVFAAKTDESTLAKLAMRVIG